MRSKSKILALILMLIVVFTFGVVSVQYITAQATPSAHLAECHAHLPKAPMPVPVNYHCCENGHHAAFLPSVENWQKPIVYLSVFDSSDAYISVNRLIEIEIRSFSSNDPPSLTSLRI